MSEAKALSVSELDLPLDRDSFLRSVIHALSTAISQTTDRETSTRIVEAAARSLATEVDAEYRRALGVDALDRRQLANVLLDLGHRLEDGVTATDYDEANDRVQLDYLDSAEDGVNAAVSAVKTAMYGFIAAHNLGYARVEEGRDRAGAPQTIISLRPGSGGREYFKT